MSSDSLFSHCVSFWLVYYVFTVFISLILSFVSVNFGLVDFFSPHHGLSFPAFFAFLITLDWTPNIVNFTFLVVG